MFSLAGWVRRMSSCTGGSKLLNEFLPSKFILFKAGTLAFHFVILTFSFPIFSNAQIEEYLNGSKYIKSEGKWYAVYGDDKSLVYDSVITVKWKPGISKKIIEDFNLKEGATIIRENILGFVDLKVNGAEDIFTVLKKYLHSGIVEIVEPSTFGVFGSLFTNDTYFGNQWYLNHIYDINAPEAWGISTGSPSVIVGILDSGTDWLHEDIGMGTDGYQNVWVNTIDTWSDPNNRTSGDSIDNDSNGYIDDYKGWNFIDNNNDTRATGDGHGTIIAGLIAAKTNNHKGVAGVAGGWGSPGVRLLITKISPRQQAPRSDVIDDAILYAVNNGAKIINMSFTFPAPIQSIDAAINYAYNNGCVLNALSGNTSPNSICNIQYPACHPYVIAVSGTMKDGSAFPSCGRSNQYCPDSVNISAPAGRLSQVFTDWWIFTTKAPNTYGWNDYGGCYSTALVSGVAALVLSVRPDLTPAQVKCVLEQTATDSGTPGWDSKFGWGRINAYRALQAIIIKLISPLNNSNGSIPQTLVWNQLYGAASYSVQVATDINFTNPIFNESGITSTSVEAEGLIENTDYYWHVRADNSICGVTPVWSETWEFTALDLRKIALQPNKNKPTSFSLSKNFPDPFNPITKIKYSLPEEASVTLKVFDILGREIATIVDEQKLAGLHEVDFSGTNLPSGVYFYKIQAGKFMDVKKMILTK
jgi:hypothetical protein